MFENIVGFFKKLLKKEEEEETEGGEDIDEKNRIF